MASQVTHIVYSKWYLLNNPVEWIDQDEFICGSIFPDIRRVSTEIRKIKTHFVFGREIDRYQLEKSNSFKSGWKFHIYCDYLREKYLENLGLSNIKEAYINEGASNKLLEDFVAYNCLSKEEWRIIYELLNYKACNNDFYSNLKNPIFHWYSSIAKYIKKRPSKESMFELLINFNTPEDISRKIVKDVYLLSENKKIIELINKNLKLFRNI
jgi:hypothetical protein